MTWPLSWIDGDARPASEIRGQVTGILGTVARPEALATFLRSWEDYGLGYARLVIVDQSKDGAAFGTLQGFKVWHVIRGTYGDGASAAYQTALESVETPYYAFLEDDFVLGSSTDLGILAQAVDLGLVDIHGGALTKRMEDGSTGVQAARSLLQWPEDILHVEPVECNPEDLTVVDFITNFYVGRTQAVLDAGGWDVEQKTVAHLDFYCRMQAAQVTVGASHATWCEHRKVSPGPGYMDQRRGSLPVMRDRFLATYKIDRVTGAGGW
jgi:hypothetical protein